MAKNFYYLRIRLPSPKIGRGAGGEGTMDFVEFLFLNNKLADFFKSLSKVL
jgi:hypothetical protein